ncbi:sensor histidine kinase [Palleronia rufa]|uniref:sensor histidine kinase n=1 Tax=Palleronia rufa TaxID=1530186 RepID=UPI00056A33F7|nr:ATP-binding protein [Palleronia rufa]
MTGGRTLSRRLALLVSAGFAAIWLLAIFATALVLRSEQEEMLDLTLRDTAQILLPILSRDYLTGADTFDGSLSAAHRDAENIEESLVWLLVDREGAILAQSTASDVIDRPADPAGEGYVTTATHVFYTTPFNASGLAVRFGDPRVERYEAYRDSLLAFLIPMLAILPLGYLLVGWIARTALRPLGVLRNEIAERGDGRLDPVDAKGLPAELQAITATLNGFMVRLSRSLAGERAFATNAAHELRTPVAVALAQTQRLRAEVDGETARRAQTIEDALKRMGRLVTRLLQLARADAGIGLSDTPTDIRRVLQLVIEDSSRDPARDTRLSVSVPARPVLAHIDPDAFAIVAGNLIDNAVRHAPPGTPIDVVLSPRGVLCVRNDGAVIPAEGLSGLARRFRTSAGQSNGFGLGLHISDTIARQAGGTLTLRSPALDRDEGFEAELSIPISDVPVSEP